MSRENRTVSNGRDFPAHVKREALRASPLCLGCKREKATECDHIQPLNWGGLSTRGNCGALCGRCHWDKGHAEVACDTNAEKIALVAMWQNVHFTVAGKRRTVKLQTAHKNAAGARRIHKAKMNARLYGTRGASDAELAQHRVAAKWRRAIKPRKAG